MKTLTTWLFEVALDSIRGFFIILGINLFLLQFPSIEPWNRGFICAMGYWLINQFIDIKNIIKKSKAHGNLSNNHN